MTAGDLVTSDVQLELRGLLIGAGTNYPVTGPVEGLGDLEVRTADPARPLDHGRFAGRSFYGSRKLVVPVAILAADAADAMAKLAALGAAMRVPTTADGSFTVPLVCQLGGLRLTAFGKPSRMHVDLAHLPTGATVECLLEFTATDPRLYSDARTAIASTGAVVGGLAFPHALPHGFGFATPGTARALNAGNFGTYPTLRIDAGVGGMTNFVATKSATGESMAMTISLLGGEYVELDFANRTAYLGGTASRSNLVNRPTSAWFELDPGDNAITFSTGSGSATLTVTWRDAYIFG